MKSLLYIVNLISLPDMLMSSPVLQAKSKLSSLLLATILDVLTRAPDHLIHSVRRYVIFVISRNDVDVMQTRTFAARRFIRAFFRVLSKFCQINDATFVDGRPS